MPKSGTRDENAKSKAEAACQQRLSEIADQTLHFLSETAETATRRLGESPFSGVNSLAVVNTLTSGEAVKNLDGIGVNLRRALRELTREPAIARLVLRDDSGKEQVYFITRGDSLVGRYPMANYRSQLGRLAALPVGADEDIETSSGVRNYKVVEHATLHPLLDDGHWDSANSVMRGRGYGPVTIISLRELLRSTAPEAAADLLEALLAADRADQNVVEGLRRSAIVKMALRDQPLLNQYQDQIFRLPLNSRLMILGPPGTGKTTTLIKRLGLKLDREHLNDSERASVNRSIAGMNGHGDSWLMFTPTELLKLYVKEAFAREGVAAPDMRLQTWADYRRELARSRLGILRTAAGTGSFVLKDELDAVQGQTLQRQTSWFEDFNGVQAQTFWTEIMLHAGALAENAEPTIGRTD